MVNSFLVGVFITLAALDSGASIEISLAWEGNVSTNALTELAVVAHGDTDVALTVATESESPRISSVLKIDGSREAQAWMPVVPSSDDVAVRTQIGSDKLSSNIASQATANRKTIGTQPGIAPIVLLGEFAADRFATVAHAMQLAPSDLPRLAAAYKHIRAIVIDGNELAQLEDAQLRALVEHVGNCGRVLLIDVNVDVARLLMQRAGCGGRTIANVNRIDDVGLQLEALLNNKTQQMPGQTALQRLLVRQQTDVALMAIFLSGFLLVFTLMASVPVTRMAALGFCLIATGFTGLLWTGGHRDSFVAWAEVEDGYRVARYSGLEALASAGRGEQTFHTLSLGRSPHWITGDDVTLLWNAEPLDRQLRWLPHLLQEIQVLTSGSFAIESILRAGLTDGIATVCNLGATTTPGAFLRWGDTTYSVPALAPEQRWTPTDEDVVRQRSAPLGLLATRAQGSAIALLRPLRLPSQSRGNQQAWLLRRELDDSEVSPCRV